MLLPSLLALLTALPQAAPPPVKPAAGEASAKSGSAGNQPDLPPLNPLGYVSRRYDFKWDQLVPLGLELDALKLNSIFFNIRELKAAWLKDATFGTRAQVEVTNSATTDRIPGFAVAVFDKAGNLLGVASGGTKVGVVKAGTTETFDLNFTQVKERLRRGDYFVLSVELR